MLDPDLQRREHSGPAHAVAEGALGSALGELPGLLRDRHESPRPVIDGSELEGRRRVRIHRVVGPLPADDDLLVLNVLDDLDGESAREVGEIPRDFGSGFQTAAGAAGREVVRELFGIGNRLVGFVRSLRDIPGDGEGQLLQRAGLISLLGGCVLGALLIGHVIFLPHVAVGGNRFGRIR